MSSTSVIFITSYNTPIYKWSNDVTYLYVIAEVVRHNTTQDIEADIGSRMSHVRIVVDSGSTLVPCHFIRIDRHKFILHAKKKDF